MLRKLKAGLAKAFPRTDKHALLVRLGMLALLLAALSVGVALKLTSTRGRVPVGWVASLVTAAGHKPDVVEPPITWGTPAQQALFRAERAHGLTFTYTDLLAAIVDHQVRFATLSPKYGQVDVTLQGGVQHLVYYPPSSEPQLTERLQRAGTSVGVTPHGLANDQTFLEQIQAPLTAAILICGTLLLLGLAQKRGWLGRPGGAGGASSYAADSNPPPVRFADVAGCDEAVEELSEVVDFLRHPERYRATGAKMPSGVVLYGPPGTGKTLLAKAVAGESGKPFYSTSGSEFVEMYVGVGSGRIRSLFAQARKTGGVVFIDELDAVGRTRGGGAAGSPANDERDNTLNQLLVELDGYGGREGVVVIAATNRLDILDPALLRPGRFSRHICVSAPSEDGRLQILRVHARGKPLGDDVDLEALASGTAGATGAELAEMLNEGAIMAARESSLVIHHQHLWEGLLRVLAGPRKKSSMLAAGERETIAYHEAGHVLCAELCPTCDETLHATINPRGGAAGFAVTGLRDRALSNEQHVHEQLIHILGGRAAEFVVHGTITSGAANDLEKASQLAQRAVGEWGLSSEVGQAVAGPHGLSEEMHARVDLEVRRLVEDAYRDAVALVSEHRPQLEALAQALLAAGEIARPEIVAALGGTVSQPRRMRGAGPAPEHAASSEPVGALGARRRRERARAGLGRAMTALAAVRSRRQSREPAKMS